MDTYSKSNDYSRDEFSKNDVILYAKELENELKRVGSHNNTLMQQVNELQTQSEVKDALLEENKRLKQEIEQLRKQSQKRSLRTKRVIELQKIKDIEGSKPRAYSMNAMSVRSVSTRSISSHNSMNTIQEEKGPKIMEGYMFKKGKFNRVFQHQYFVLYANNTLSFYQEFEDPKDDEDSGVLGEICLYSVYDIKEEPNNNIFHLITAKTIYTMRCDVEEDYNRWIHILKSMISPKILCKGWLYKKGEMNKQWKLRYFTLSQLTDYAQHYEVRYYEDEKCKKYKGNINCDAITDIKLLPNSSIQKYGKDKVLEVITDHRIYVIAANDTQIRNSWYKSFKKVLFDIKSIPSNQVDKTKKKRPSFIRILQPIAEHNPFDPKLSQSPNGLIMISDNNDDIHKNEWQHCFASISPSITPNISANNSPNISPSITPCISPVSKSQDLRIMLSPSETEDYTPLGTTLSKDTEALLAKSMMPLSYNNRTSSNESDEVFDFPRGRASSKNSPWSYMSNNSVLLMDINTEYNKLGQLINEFDNKSSEIYDKMSYDQVKGCDLIIQSPFEFNSFK